MKKRSCRRFNIPGTTLFYKSKTSLFRAHTYPEDYFPVINMSKGGAQFLCNERLKTGKELSVKFIIPGEAEPIELLADVRWISKNREVSYSYQTGLAFKSYGEKKNENPREILDRLEALESNSKEG